MELDALMYTIIVMVLLPLLYLVSTWRADYFEKEGSALVATIIILVIAIPHDGLMRDYNTVYCNGYHTDITPNELFILNKNKGFFSCEIGFIGGYANLEIGIELPKSLEKEIVNIMILDYKNYNAFLDGEVYGVNNVDLLIDLEFVKFDSSTAADIEVDVTFLEETYFLVINWAYRTTYSPEEVYYPYFIEDGNNDDCQWENDNSDPWENNDCTVFYHYLDVDYFNPETGNIIRSGTRPTS
tara:strand:- start:20 stop:742 length:723 start_codon:yes stop_codon:yes gene_type:complete